MMYKAYIKVEDFLESLKNNIGDTSQKHLMEHTGQDCFHSPLYMILLKLHRVTPVNISTAVAFREEHYRMNEQVYLCKPLG